MLAPDRSSVCLPVAAPPPPAPPPPVTQTAAEGCDLLGSAPPPRGVTYYRSLRAEPVSLRDKLCVVQLEESGTKLSFRFSCEGQLTV